MGELNEIDLLVAEIEEILWRGVDALTSASAEQLKVRLQNLLRHANALSRILNELNELHRRELFEKDVKIWELEAKISKETYAYWD